MSISYKKGAVMRLFLLIFLLPFTIFAATITNQNWYLHPNIVKIRKEFKTIETNVKSQNYQIEKKSWSSMGISKEITLYRDKKGYIKKLFIEGGTGDSYHKGEYFYKAGKLFFSYVVSRNYHECSTEIRSYFLNDRLIFRKTTNAKKCAYEPHMLRVIKNPQRYFNQFNQEPDDE